MFVKKKENVHNTLAFKGRRDAIGEEICDEKISTLMESVTHKSPAAAPPPASAELRCHPLICAVDSVSFRITSLALP